MEFREECTEKVTVDKTELCKKLRKLQNGVIIELDHGKYQLYYSKEKDGEQDCIQDMAYRLNIDPAARVRFEGSFEEYEELLRKIDKDKVYSKLREGNVDSDFFIMDVYYRM